VKTQARVGKLEKIITVSSNDPQTPKLQLKVAGTVERIAGFEPNRINLEKVLTGTTTTKTVEIFAKDPEKFQITKLTASDPESFKAETITENGKPAVKVTFTAGDKEKAFSGRITAETNLSSPKQIDLYVFGKVSSDLVLDKEYAFFNPIDPKNPSTVELRVSSLSAKPFKLTKVEDSSGSIQGTFAKKGKDWLVTLKLIKEPQDPRGKFKLVTDRKDQPRLEVFYVINKPGAKITPPGISGHPISSTIAPKMMAPIQLRDQKLKSVQIAPSSPIPPHKPPVNP
jgi:hypothetical protein